MPITGSDVVAANIQKFGGGFLKHVEKVMGVVVDMLDEDITHNIGLTDHTLAELAALDHPYATRHGPQGMPIHNPPWLIHNQGGRLLSSKKRGVSDATIVNGSLAVSGYVQLDDTIAPHALYLIWGTSKMVPRDALSGSLYDPKFQSRAGDHLKTNLRDFVFGFKGTETR
jgi:hypothetical protein